MRRLPTTKAELEAARALIEAAYLTQADLEFVRYLRGTNELEVGLILIIPYRDHSMADMVALAAACQLILCNPHRLSVSEALVQLSLLGDNDVNHS